MTSENENPRRQPNLSKSPARVDRQLETLKAVPPEDENNTVAPSITEGAFNGVPEAAETKLQPAQAEFSRGQLGKAKRAFAKAGQPDTSEEVRKKWLAEMSVANVVVMSLRHRGSRKR